MSTLAEVGPFRGGTRSTRRAGWLRGGLVLLAVVALAVQAYCFYEEVKIRTIPKFTGFRLSPDLVMTLKTDAALKVGIQEGDRVVALGGEPVSKILDYRRVIDRFGAGETVVLTILRDGETVTLPPAPVEARPLQVSALLRHIAGLAFLFMAALVALVGPEKRSARLFVVASILLGLYVALIRSPRPGLVYVQTVALAFAPPTIIHFFLSFPEERALVRSRWIWLLYGPSLVLVVLALWAYHDAVLAGTGRFDAPLYGLLADQIGFAYLLFSGLLGLILSAHVYATTSLGIQRRQLQWIMLGLLCALVFAAVDLVLTLSAGQTQQIFPWLLLGFLPIPITFGLAILRYRLWDLDLVLSRSVVYGLLTASLATIYLLLVSGLSTALGIAAGSGQYTMVLFLSALAIGLLVNPLRGRLQAIIDRIFFRRQLDHQATLATWSEELGSSLRFADLARLLLQEVPERLQVEQAWLFVLDEGESRLGLLSPLETGPGPMGDLTIAAHSAFAVHLARPGAVLLLHNEAAVPEPLDGEAEAALAKWREIGVALVLPLISGGQAAEGPRLVGIYLLGQKRSGDIYQRQEMDFLRTLSNQAAIAISNARLYEQVTGLSQELELKVEERTKELRDFVSVVYHELSTPITSIRGYNDLLLDTEVGLMSGRQVRYLSAIRRSVSRLMRLVADLSDVSMIENGRLTIHPEPLDLHKAVAETLGLLQGVIEEKGLQLTVSIAPDSATILGDRHRVVQILTNLVGNACRYTPAGGQIAITADRVQGSPRAGGPGSDQVELRVSDTGIGISRTELEHIFERFYRGQDPIVQEQPGTGLGLSITRSLVELHGSQLWVNSTVGKGSTFGFALPRVEEAQDRSASGSLKAEAASEGGLD
jgi:signal transduction histidine kinase